MNDGPGLLTAIYRDGRVHIGGKIYTADTFALPITLSESLLAAQ